MASLHRDSRGKSPYWIGAYTDQFGKQRKQSTKSTDKRAAKAIVDGWQHAADLARAGKLTEAKAREVLNDILTRSGKKPIYAPTIKAYLKDWLAEQQGETSEADHGKKELTVRLFLESLHGRESVQLEDIAQTDIVHFRDQLLAKGRRPATADALVRNILAQAFRAAKNDGLIHINPIASLKKQRGTRKVEKGTFSPEQISRLVASAQGDWKGLIIAGFYTGARLSDLANLKWSNVDLAKKIPTLSFHQRKTDKTVVMPLHDELADYLEALPSNDSNDAPLFPSLYGRSMSGSTGLSAAFTRIMKHAGIVSAALRDRAEGVSRTVNALSFHSLRHSFNSAMLNAGVSQELRMKMTGHSSTSMNDIYSHHEMETIRGALN